MVEIAKELSVEVLEQQLANISGNDLYVLAQERAKFILSKIEDVGQKIARAKELNEDADDAESDWSNRLSFGIFGDSKTDKRSKLNTRATAMQNEAMAEMNTLIQQSVALTICSTVFAKYMIEEMALIVKNGFTDAHGGIQHLSKASKEKAKFIITQAQAAVERHAQSEAKFNALHTSLETHKEEYEQRFAQKDDLDKQQSKDIDYLKGVVREKKEKLAEIHTKLDEKKAIDDKQEEAIRNLQGDMEAKRQKLDNLYSALESKKAIDDSQEQQIQELHNKVAKLQDDVSMLEKRNSHVALACSVVSLVIAAISIGLHFLKV